ELGAERLRIVDGESPEQRPRCQLRLGRRWGGGDERAVRRRLGHGLGAVWLHGAPFCGVRMVSAGFSGILCGWRRAGASGGAAGFRRPPRGAPRAGPVFPPPPPRTAPFPSPGRVPRAPPCLSPPSAPPPP